VFAIEALDSRGLGVVTTDPVSGAGLPQIVSTAGGESNHAAIAVDPAGDLIVGWQHRSGPPELGTAGTAVALRPAGQPFGPATELDFGPSPTLAVTDPAVAITDQGVASVAWTHASGPTITQLLTLSVAAGKPSGVNVVAYGPTAASVPTQRQRYPRVTSVRFPGGPLGRDHQGRIGVELLCGEPRAPIQSETCDGTLKLTLRGRSPVKLGLKHFRLPVNHATVIYLPLLVDAGGLHHSRRGLPARAITRTHYSTGRITSDSENVVIPP
jgi:hypothetical protein